MLQRKYQRNGYLQEKQEHSDKASTKEDRVIWQQSTRWRGDPTERRRQSSRHGRSKRPRRQSIHHRNRCDLGIKASTEMTAKYPPREPQRCFSRQPLQGRTRSTHRHNKELQHAGKIISIYTSLPTVVYTSLGETIIYCTFNNS